jgi:hypothetical protein
MVTKQFQGLDTVEGRNARTRSGFVPAPPALLYTEFATPWER